MHNIEFSRSVEGALRLPLATMRKLRFRHLLSGLDDPDPSQPPDRCGHQTALTGYTEWVSEGPGPTVSIGWDWCIPAASGPWRCLRVSVPRSNVVLVNRHHQTIEWHRNLALQAAVVDTFAWSDTTCDAILVQYA